MSPVSANVYVPILGDAAQPTPLFPPISHTEIEHEVAVITGVSPYCPARFLCFFSSEKAQQI